MMQLSKTASLFTHSHNVQNLLGFQCMIFFNNILVTPFNIMNVNVHHIFPLYPFSEIK